MEDYCTFEQAKALRELGFDYPTSAYYWQSKTDLYFGELLNRNNEVDYKSAPTLSQAQKWLREVKKIYVFSHIIGYPPRDKCKYYWKVETNNSRTVDSSALTELSLTYEQALSAGIDKALKFLKEN